jgi:hypothetical protein
MARSFFTMRWGLLTVGALFPAVLRIGEQIAAPHHAQPLSISGYYHTHMRNILVGALVALGLLLFLYKAFNKLENLLLNTAGIAAVGVALFPTEPDIGATDGSTTGYLVHGWFALVAFAAMGIVAVSFAGDTVSHLPKESQRSVFRQLYRFLGVAMIAFPGLAWLASHRGWGSLFWVEWTGMLVFAGYWAVKTVEFKLTSAEKLAMRGEFEFPGRVGMPDPREADDGRPTVVSEPRPAR